MRQSSLVTIALLALAPMALAAGVGDLKPQSAKVYKGKNGERVTLVRLAGFSPAEALIKISGSDTSLDGKVLRCELKEWSDAQDWATYELGKSRFVVLTRRAGHFQLYPPTGPALPLVFDEKGTGEANGEPIIAEYQAAHR